MIAYVDCRMFGVVALLVGSTTQGLGAQSFPPPLTNDQAHEVQRAITAMKEDPRGPYLRIRWFCNDGTIQPPQGAACRERGGGVQHAELNDRAKRLAQLDVHVGTILQATPFDALFDRERDHYRLKELVVAEYLFEIDGGWALKQARFYRGAKQIEDEEARGQEYLQRMLADTSWTRRNFLLTSQLVRTIPHPRIGDEQSTHRIRNLATEIATLDPGFLNLRIKIHSFPSRDDLDAVTSYLTSKNHGDEVRSKLAELTDELRQQYDAKRNVEELARYERRLRRVVGPQLQALQQSYQNESSRRTLQRTALLAAEVRQRVSASADGRTNLVLLDLLATLQEQAFLLAQELEADTATAIPRHDRLTRLSDYFALAFSGGFLSSRERQALDEEIARLRGMPKLTAGAYKDGLNYLGRSLDWAAATVRSVFAPTQQRYLAFEPKAVGFLDAVVRGSSLLPQSVQLAYLGADADRVLGASHRVFGRDISQGIRGLNPGFAMQRLEIVDPRITDWHLEPTTIYVLPETTAEIRPPAGVLTLDAGNLLSHVQLLARNLGIPNSTMSSALLPMVQPYHGREVFYAVSPMGRVVLQDPARLGDVERRIVELGRQAPPAKVQLNTSRLRLDRTQPIPLRELRADQSGVFVGPKAANLGQLAFYFPDHVSRGVALPFGMFYQHANRPFGSQQSVLQELANAYREAARMRARGRAETEIDEYMFGVLARVRTAILELPWLPEVRGAIVDALRTTFNDDVSGGVFIRSDTNVEDLPQFSGAGLNLTVPHQRTVEDILTSIKRVWTSPFSERAYLWRKQILEEQGQIYPSVLLLESVPSDKSGVLITSGLQFGSRDDLTIATAEGVGGAVEGEDAETVVVDAQSGAVTLLSQAKAPFRRILVTTGAGGGRMVAARRPDELLRPSDVRQLEEVVASWKRRLTGDDRGQVWDIEFGFTGDKLWLFQIRPFVRFRSSELIERLNVLDLDTRRRGSRSISLQEAV